MFVNKLIILIIICKCLILNWTFTHNVKFTSRHNVDEVVVKVNINEKTFWNRSFGMAPITLLAVLNASALLIPIFQGPVSLKVSV